METVTISKKVYERLKKDAETLDKLHRAGVDNWEGYSFAFDDEDEEDDDE